MKLGQTHGEARTRALDAVKFQRQFPGHWSQQRAGSVITCSNRIQKHPGEQEYCIQPGQMCKIPHCSVCVCFP